MADFRSDAFVFFGATGDLAHKQIFPSLEALIRDEGLNLPIIGVAKRAGISINLRRVPRTVSKSMGVSIPMRSTN